MACDIYGWVGFEFGSCPSVWGGVAVYAAFSKCHVFSFPLPLSRGLYSLNSCTMELILLIKFFQVGQLEMATVVTCHLFSHHITNLQEIGMWIRVKTLMRCMKV